MIGPEHRKGKFYDLSRLLNQNPFLLLKLAEESSELSSAVNKYLSFVASGKHPESTFLEESGKIYSEVADVINTLNLLFEAGIFSEDLTWGWIQTKQNKVVRKYDNLSEYS
jgi:NTP pyrophosphatase (non-canonical NTP hydrolase)